MDTRQQTESTGSPDSTAIACVDLTAAAIVLGPNPTEAERKAVVVLVEEVEKRARIRWETTSTWTAARRPAIVVVLASALGAIANPPPALSDVDWDPNVAEGYRIQVVQDDLGAPVVLLVGNDARGVLYAVGHLLRTLRMYPGHITLPDGLDIATAPRYALRGHQLGYRDKTNSYCGWDLAQWDQYIRDVVVFGANAIELIPPRSDDRPNSVHFPLPPMEMMAGMSQLAGGYGIDVWIWYPALDADYANPATVAFALEEWGQVFQRLPRIDAVFVPGGDPGRTRPKHLMPLLQKQTALLRTHHPQAQMWVSPQGFTQEWMDEFVGILRGESPDWLSGVVFGPWVHMTTAAFRELIPEQYPIRNYPDITHNLSCQHPVPDWDVAYALTEGRESINPRPLDQAAIFRTEQPPTVGFLTYSEGCNDDVNKCIWSAMGWDPDRRVIDILREYSRYYIGERYTEVFAQGLLALERNWRGPLACNVGVYTTLRQFQAMEASATPRDLKNWRFQQALYRAYYDAYVRSRLLVETGLEEQATDRLRQAPDVGSLTAIAEAERILDRAVMERVSGCWRTRIWLLAEALFQSIHMQLHVGRYRGQAEVRGANLDGLDYPLNNGPWLGERLAEIRELAAERDRLEAIHALLGWTDPGPGGFYDDFSHPSRQSRLAPGPAFEHDPTFLQSPLRQFPYQKDPRALRLSWRSATGCIGDGSWEVCYSNLDPAARYGVRIVYPAGDAEIAVRLEANDGIEIHPCLLRPASYEPVEYEIPRHATQSGELVLRWQREPGRGRAGRGCAVSEVWLVVLAEKVVRSGNSRPTRMAQTADSS